MKGIKLGLNFGQTGICVLILLNLFLLLGNIMQQPAEADLGAENNNRVLHTSDCLLYQTLEL